MTWRKWVGWFCRRQIDPVLCDITPILDFIGELLMLGMSIEKLIIWSAISRSVISAYHQTIDGKGVGLNDKVCKLFSGVFNFHPPQPKCTFIWDVQTVLEYIKMN